MSYPDEAGFPQPMKSDDPDLDLQAAFQAAYTDAASFNDSEIAPERETATDAYFCRPDGTEEEGLSTQMVPTVRDSADAMIPDLMRIFASTTKLVEYSPRFPEDVEGAQQATDYVEHILNNENQGFVLIHTAVKDALIRKAGILKWYWDDTPSVTYHRMSGLSPMAAQMLRADPEVEILEENLLIEGKVIEQSQAAMYLPQAIEMASGMMMQEAGAQLAIQPMPGTENPPLPQFTPSALLSATVNLRIKRTRRRGRAKVVAVPPEEFVFARDARDLDTASFVGHRRIATVSELVEMYPNRREDIEEHSGSYDSLHMNTEAMRRTPWGSYEYREPTADPSMRRTLYVEGYMRYDSDDDGIAELHKICAIGDANFVIYDEIVDEVPFAVFSPYPEPHCLIGRSLADNLLDLQRTNTAMMRAYLNGLALAVNPRMAYVIGQVNVEDLMNTEVGALIGMRTPGAVTALNAQFDGRQILDGLMLNERMASKRTGISEASQGLDPDALQSTTRAGVTATVSAAQARVEMVARAFAEIGLSRLGRGLLRLITKNQDRPTVVRLRNRWVEIDPRSWDAEMDVTVNVALGRGDDQSRLASLMQVATAQERALTTMGMSNPLAGPSELRNTWSRILHLMNLKDVDAFFKPLDPEAIAAYEQQVNAPRPDPNLILAEAQAEKVRVDAQVALMRVEAEREATRLKDDRERDKLDAEIAIKAAELRLKNESLDIATIQALISRERDQMMAARGGNQ